LLLTTDRINLRTKRYRKCHKPEPVGIFYTVWYVNLFDRYPVVSSKKKKWQLLQMTVTIYRLCVDGDMENTETTHHGDTDLTHYACKQKNKFCFNSFCGVNKLILQP